MQNDSSKPSTLATLKSGELSLLLSFLALSEKEPGDDQTAIDEIGLSLAVKSSLNGPQN